MIDAHIHLEQYELQNLERAIDNWKSAGIEAVIAVSNDLASSYHTLELRSRFPGFVYAAVGFHPENPLPSEADFLEWQRLVAQEKENISAIGEIGLPHYELEQLPHSMDEYRDFFAHCLDIARNNHLPVALHAVHDKAKIVFELLQKKGVEKAHFHWLKAPVEVVRQIVQAGYYVSVTPEICYWERDQNLAAQIPISQLLIETDGPWQYDDTFRHKITTPLMLREIIHKLSEIKGMSIEQLQRQTTMNTRLCFDLND